MPAHDQFTLEFDPGDQEEQNTASKPSAVQCPADRSRPSAGIPTWKSRIPSYTPLRGLFAHTGATTAAARSTRPPTVSVRSARARA